MVDSETTKTQKLALLQELRNCVGYLETHGLECISVADLRAAYRALDRMEVLDYGRSAEGEVPQGN